MAQQNSQPRQGTMDKGIDTTRDSSRQGQAKDLGRDKDSQIDRTQKSDALKNQDFDKKQSGNR